MAQPEKQFRIGFCSASVFVNQVNSDGGKKRKIRNVQLQRRYKDGEEWKSTTSFGLGDLPNAIRRMRSAAWNWPCSTSRASKQTCRSGRSTTRVKRTVARCGHRPLPMAWPAMHGIDAPDHASSGTSDRWGGTVVSAAA